MTNHILRLQESEDSRREIEITPEQAREFMAGRPFAYYPHDERIAVDPTTGQVVRRESAIPPRQPGE
jgi:hypothetical protein